jgi:hypothetical protein
MLPADDQDDDDDDGFRCGDDDDTDDDDDNHQPVAAITESQEGYIAFGTRKGRAMHHTCLLMCVFGTDPRGVCCVRAWLFPEAAKFVEKIMTDGVTLVSEASTAALMKMQDKESLDGAGFLRLVSKQFISELTKLHSNLSSLVTGYHSVFQQIHDDTSWQSPPALGSARQCSYSSDSGSNTNCKKSSLDSQFC